MTHAAGFGDPTIPLWVFRIRGFPRKRPDKWSVPVRAAIAATLWAFAMFFLGLAWSWLFGFKDLFANAAMSIHLPASVALMFAGVYWGAITIEMKVEPILESFKGTAARDEVHRMLQNWDGKRPAAAGILAIWILALAVMGHASGTLVPGDPWVSSAEQEWFGEVSIAKTLLVLIWGVPTGAIVGTGIWGLLTVWWITIRLAGYDLIERPAFVLPRLREFVLFEQFLGLAWSGYVLQAYVATFQARGPIAFSYVVITAAAAVAFLSWPHIAFHLPLRRLDLGLTASIRRQADRALEDTTVGAAERVRILTSVGSAPTFTWLYDVRVLLSFASGPLASAAIALFGTRDPLIGLLGCVLLGRCG